MTYIGIDPGKKGGLAVIREDGAVELASFDKRAYLDILSNYGDFETAAVVCLEHVSSMPGQGVASTFSFGENFGWLQGVLDAYGIKYELVRPQKWKKEYSVTADKNGSIEVAHRLFPTVDLRRTEKCRTDDDGLAEALLMAEYARRHF